MKSKKSNYDYQVESGKEGHDKINYNPTKNNDVDNIDNNKKMSLNISL
ncbi:MAG: hypothetical protein AB7V56_06550 [Candidatus Nitrosocosmicus sp.]